MLSNKKIKIDIIEICKKVKWKHDTSSNPTIYEFKKRVNSKYILTTLNNGKHLQEITLPLDKIEPYTTLADKEKIGEALEKKYEKRINQLVKKTYESSELNTMVGKVIQYFISYAFNEPQVKPLSRRERAKIYNEKNNPTPIEVFLTDQQKHNVVEIGLDILSIEVTQDKSIYIEEYTESAIELDLSPESILNKMYQLSDESISESEISSIVNQTIENISKLENNDDEKI